MKLAREGYPLVGGLGVATFLVQLLGFWWVALALLLLTFFVASFFRDPEREPPEGANLVVSPADGRVVAVDGASPEHAFPGTAFRRVSIFMSPLNVHVNRIPETGQVVAVEHTAGKFSAAFNDEASRENERTEVALRDAKGRPLVFTQIAGMLARRIVCRLEPGDRVERGARFGLIMFGSKVDVYLPIPSSVRVQVGDRVSAGSDVLGELE